MLFWLVPVVFVVVLWIFITHVRRTQNAQDVDQRDSDENSRGFIDAFICTFIAALLTAGILYGLGFCVVYGVAEYDDNAAVTTVIESKKQEIVALSDGSVMSGHFFLGIGSIDEESYYFYVIKVDGLKTMKKMKTNDVWIDDSGQMEPCIEYATTKTVSPLINHDHAVYKWFFPPEDEDSHDEKKTIIHVPPGSMTTEFNIDLK